MKEATLLSEGGEGDECNGRDEDCDGTVDEHCENEEESDPVAEAFDSDGDGYTTNSDCNDSDSAIHPSASETCDSVDNNCDGTTDEGVMTTYYRDSDDDGFGNANNWAEACTQPDGYVENRGDCDDTHAFFTNNCS